MVRESQAGACWDIPLCTPKQAKQEAGDGAGTSQGNPAQNNGAASQANSADTVGPALSAVLDELQQVQNLTVCSDRDVPVTQSNTLFHNFVYTYITASEASFTSTLSCLLALCLPLTQGSSQFPHSNRFEWPLRLTTSKWTSRLMACSP